MYRFLTGIVKIKIISSCNESVINRIRYFVPINDIVRIDERVFEFVTGYRYYKAVENLLNELNCKYEVVYKKGLPAYFSRYKGRLGMWIGIALSIFIISYFSGLIWEIRISGNTYVSDYEILNTLKICGLYEGGKIDKEMLDEMYNDFLIKEPRISWLSVNYDGTVGRVEVKETKITPPRIDRNGNINVVAKCDAVVERVDVFDGMSETQKGDTVTKGQLLISPFTQSRKTGTFMRAARGNVWGKTQRKYQVYINKTHNELIEKSVLNNKTIIILGNRIPINKRENSKSDYFEISYSSLRYLLFGLYPMPFMIENETIKAYDSIKTNLPIESARALANDEILRRTTIDITNGKIYERDLEETENDDCYIFTYTLSCYENISEYEEFAFE